MTLSEQICQDLNRKFYFDDFVLNNLFYYKNGIKTEICDGLIEFDNTYVILQIKERNTINEDDTDWLNKKVYKKAVSQIKTTLQIIKESPHLCVEDMYGQQVMINQQKEILPIIVFKNDNVEEYKKVYHSSMKNININIFSLQDYETMMKILLMPVDILDYLSIRSELFKKENIELIVDDDMVVSINNENDFVNYFLAKQSMGKPYNIKAVKSFLKILQQFRQKIVPPVKNNYKEILFKLLRLNRFSSQIFMDRWNRCWNDSMTMEINFKHHIVMKCENELIGFIFISSNLGFDEKRAGHASERITLGIYTHVLQSQDEQAAETLNNYLLGG